MPQPAKTPIEPSKRAGGWPASSSASQAHSMKWRCCGSVIAASFGPKPKNPASKPSSSDSSPPAFT
jgi:hypothetical protein